MVGSRAWTDHPASPVRVEGGASAPPLQNALVDPDSIRWFVRRDRASAEGDIAHHDRVAGALGAVAAINAH